MSRREDEAGNAFALFIVLVLFSCAFLAGFIVRGMFF